MIEFAMILDGASAPVPAPRIAAVPSATGIGVYDPASGEIWRPCDESIRAALPARLRRYVATREFLRCWFDNRARIENGRCVPSLPYLEICDARGKRIATAYFAPVQETRP
jgi:hypothetical protein